MAYKEYKVVLVAEGGCGTIIFGASGMPVKQLEMVLNKEAAAGWRVFQVIEQKQFWLFGNARQFSSRWAASAPRARLHSLLPGSGRR